MGAGFGNTGTQLPPLTGFDAESVARALGISPTPAYDQQTKNPLAQMLANVPPSPAIGGGPLQVPYDIPAVADRPAYVSQIPTRDASGKVTGNTWREIIPARAGEPAHRTTKQWGYQADRLLRFTPEGGPLLPAFAPYPGGNAGQGGGTSPTQTPISTPSPTPISLGRPTPTGPTVPPGPVPRPMPDVPTTPTLPIGSPGTSSYGGNSNTAPIVRGPENEDWERGRVIGPNETERVYHLAPKTQERIKDTLYNYVAIKNTPALDWYKQPINNTQFGSPSFPLTPDKMPAMREGESAIQYAMRLGLSPNEASEYLAHLATGNG